MLHKDKDNMNFKIDHIGYLTGDIGKTTEQFELLGFSVVGGGNL